MNQWGSEVFTVRHSTWYYLCILFWISAHEHLEFTDQNSKVVTFICKEKPYSSMWRGGSLLRTIRYMWQAGTFKLSNWGILIILVVGALAAPSVLISTVLPKTLEEYRHSNHQSHLELAITDTLHCVIKTHSLSLCDYQRSRCNRSRRATPLYGSE